MPRVPSFDPANRNPRVGPLQLPAEGRKGQAPSWPLPGRMRAGELDLWRKLWRTPQAVAWERLGEGVRMVVARYVRYSVTAMNDPGNATAAAEVRQLEDRLGLTPKAMRLMLWTVVGETPQEARRQRARESGEQRGTNVRDIRERIPAVVADAEE